MAKIKKNQLLSLLQSLIDLKILPPSYHIGAEGKLKNHTKVVVPTTNTDEIYYFLQGVEHFDRMQGDQEMSLTEIVQHHISLDMFKSLSISDVVVKLNSWNIEDLRSFLKSCDSNGEYNDENEGWTLDKNYAIETIIKWTFFDN